MSVENDFDILSDGQGTYSDLRDEINAGGNNISLAKSNYRYVASDGDTIEIGNSSVIDGKGAVIDMAGFNVQGFRVSASGVTIKNLTIKNVNYDGYDGAIYFSSSCTVDNCNFINNTAESGGAIYFDDNYVVTNCNFINNAASLYGGAIYSIYSSKGNVSNCNFINNAAEYGGAIFSKGKISNCNFDNNSAKAGGAIQLISGSVENCNFTNNKATTSYGGAIMSSGSNGVVTKCNFVNNSATYHGAVSMGDDCKVINCSFTNNYARENAGAMGFMWGIVENCYFDSNYARENAGAINFKEGNITNCNFVNNSASDGGAVCTDCGSIENCYFVNNTASLKGGALLFNWNVKYINHFPEEGPVEYFWSDGKVINCNFVNNSATKYWGGAIYMYSGSVESCKFSNNTAYDKGGAIYFKCCIDSPITDRLVYYDLDKGSVIDCDFTNNMVTSGDGGAIHFDWNRLKVNVLSNCNFTNNKATLGNGGAINIGSGVVGNCNFTVNKAYRGSAICFYSSSVDKNIYNSNFFNNKANADALQVTQCDNNIEVVFIGQDNILNAIYSVDDINVTNVNYWGAKGIVNTGNLTTVPVRSQNEGGQNITVIGVVNDSHLNATMVTDSNGKIVLEGIAGNYYIVARHDADLYYTSAETIITNFYVNVTPIKTNNKTVNITAKSNINDEIIDGKLFFILPKGTKISANYNYKGVWWALHTFDDYGVDYKVTASYGDLDGVTINSATISIVKINTELTANAITTTYNINKDLVITLKDDNGNPLSGVKLSVDLNGVKEYPTDKNGQIKVSTKGLVPKTYAAKVKFNGNNKYDKSTKEVKVTVKKATPKLTAKNKVFKANTKTKNYAVTLKTNQNKIMKNNKVYLKINGKSYSAKTNAKGQATFKITKLTKKGKFTVTVTYKGDAYYFKLVKKVKITIK